MSSPGPADLSSFRREWSALLASASPVSGGYHFAALLGPVDWARLLVLAEEHGVVGHVVAHLPAVDESLVPGEFRQRLMARHREQVFSTLRMTAELMRVLEFFRAGGIPALTVKGPVLAMRAYGDPAMRAYGDLDLLVRQRDIRPATQAMLAAGYEAAVPLSAIDAGKIPGQYLFSNLDSKLLVELHNDLTLRYFPRPLPIEDFFARQTRVCLDGQEAPALAVEDELVLICIHGAKHFWERLVWIADVAGLVTRQAGMDWERAVQSARTVRAERLLHTGLRLASDLLHAPLPEKMLSQVLADRSARKLSEKILSWLPAAGYAPPGLFERAAFRLRMRGSLISGLAYLLRLSFSTTEEDWGSPSPSRHSRLLEVVRRPFRLARKHSGKGYP